MNATPLFDGKVSSFYWSWKPHDANGSNRDYRTLHEKFTEYIFYVSGPAEAKYPNFKVTPFAAIAQSSQECPFPFEDMNSARANLGELDKLLAGDTIAIIGVGGTGSYVFDLISKTRVKAIKLFDFDVLDLHNAFRVPGATDREELGQPKVRVIDRRYAGWHKGTQAYEAKVDGGSEELLHDVTFAFLAVDKVDARREIAKLLLARNIPIVVVGMGIHHGSPGLTGMVDTTLLDNQTPAGILAEIVGDELADIPDEYQKNIQTAELNALNAAMAVFMYKKYRGYYAGGASVCQASFTISSMQLDREFSN
nr:ThiF family adenylyltransferase [Mesorhizobium sp.]